MSRLTGCHVVVTRPKHQAQSLVESIEAQGGKAILFPTLAIERQPLSVSLDPTFLSQFDLAIFTSTNALPTEEVLSAWPNTLPVVAIGPATAKALEEHPIPLFQQPLPPYNSESLLALPAMQESQDQNILIFTGENARRLLPETLVSRGARVTELPVYRRIRTQSTPAALAALMDSKQRDVVVTTSLEGLKSWVERFPPSFSLKDIPLLVISDRMAEHARASLNPTCLLQAENAGHEAIVTALTDWWETQNGRDKRTI